MQKHLAIVGLAVAMTGCGGGGSGGGTSDTATPVIEPPKEAIPGVYQVAGQVLDNGDIVDGIAIVAPSRFIGFFEQASRPDRDGLTQTALRGSIDIPLPIASGASLKEELGPGGTIVKEESIYERTLTYGIDSLTVARDDAPDIVYELITPREGSQPPFDATGVYTIDVGPDRLDATSPEGVQATVVLRADATFEMIEANGCTLTGKIGPITPDIGTGVRTFRFMGARENCEATEFDTEFDLIAGQYSGVGAVNSDGEIVLIGNNQDVSLAVTGQK